MRGRIIMGATALALMLLISVAQAAIIGNLNWVRSGQDTGARVERQVNGGVYTVVATVSEGTVAYADATLVAGNDYCYRIVEFNTFGDGPASNVACGSTKVPAGASGLTLIINVQ